MTFFRCWPVDEDPRALLNPSEQYSTPWGEPDHGPCGKCGATGEVRWRCFSCLAEAAEDCPACAGRIEFLGRCPTCEGDGEVTRTRRDGVSVFPTLAGLYLYMAERAADADGQCVVELDGPVAEDEDLDADAGALLVKPERIIARTDFSPERLAQARAAIAE